MKAEREALFGHTEEEIEGWGTGDPYKVDGGVVQGVNEMLRNREVGVGMQGRGESWASALKSEGNFTHVNHENGRPQMVDVASKAVTVRTAVAVASLVFPPAVASAFESSAAAQTSGLRNKKGPVFDTATLAGIMGAKKTSDLIPLCHPLPLDSVNVDIDFAEDGVGGKDYARATITCTAKCTGKTGVEMEAMVGANVAALTVYDMVKGLSHDVTIEGVKLVGKTGGKSDIGDIGES